jgi:hypothetical protein
MPVDLQVIRACEFVRMGAHGEFDFEGTRDVLKSLAAACRKRAVDRALIDVRGATSTLTPEDLAALVAVFGKTVVSRRFRLAIVHADHQKFRARLFAFFSAMRGRKAKAFVNFEEALDWLSTPENTDEKDAAGAVPIRMAKARGTRIPVQDELAD